MWVNPIHYRCFICTTLSNAQLRSNYVLFTWSFVLRMGLAKSSLNRMYCSRTTFSTSTCEAQRQIDMEEKRGFSNNYAPFGQDVPKLFSMAQAKGCSYRAFPRIYSWTDPTSCRESGILGWNFSWSCTQALAWASGKKRIHTVARRNQTKGVSTLWGVIVAQIAQVCLTFI